MIQKPKFQPHLKYTLWKDLQFPAWAMPINLYDEMICECEMLPVIARYTVATRRHTFEQLACPACLHLVMAEQGEYDKVQANQEYDAIQPPNRANERLYLYQIFGDTRGRLAYWKAAGLKLFSDASRSALKAHKSVLYSDLVQFLKDADTWHLWAPGKIQDTELKEWAINLQSAWPWRWLNGWQAADYLSYASSNSLIHNRDAFEPVLGPRPNDKKRGGGKIHFYRTDRLEWFKQELMPRLIMGKTSYHRLHGEPLHTHMIHIPDSYRDDLMALGGSLSKGVRKLVERYREERDAKSGEG